MRNAEVASIGIKESRKVPQPRDPVKLSHKREESDQNRFCLPGTVFVSKHR